MNEKRDKLDEIFRLKDEFERKFFDLDGMNQEEREKLTLEVSMMLVSEVAELLREMNYKLLKTEFIDIDREKLYGEISDIGHFFIFICLIWELNSETFFEEFLKTDKKIQGRTFVN